MKIDGAICAVTGVGRGLGRQIAVDLAVKGARVYGCDVSDDALMSIRDEAAQRDLSVTCFVCDVRHEDPVATFFKAIADREGRLDVLVNNAGIIRDGLLIKVKDGTISRMSLPDFRDVIDVNLTGVFLCGREAAAMMVGSGGGVIINMSSVSRAGNFGQTNYSASKAGVAAMTVTWSRELARYNIRVAAIAPGYISTEMVTRIDRPLLEKLIAGVPLKRLGEPSEISRTVQFIIENDFVNGRVLEIDGGLRL